MSLGMLVYMMIPKQSRQNPWNSQSFQGSYFFNKHTVSSAINRSSSSRCFMMDSHFTHYCVLWSLLSISRDIFTHLKWHRFCWALWYKRGRIILTSNESKFIFNTSLKFAQEVWQNLIIDNMNYWHSWHLLFQRQHWKHQNNMWNWWRFSGVFIINFSNNFQTLFRCFHCLLWKNESQRGKM